MKSRRKWKTPRADKPLAAKGDMMAQVRKTVSGQTITETVVLMPVFLLLAFAILQACHLGIAVAVVSYGASAVARQAVQQNDSNLLSGAQQRFDSLMVAGLKPLPLKGGVQKDESITSNISVTACAELPAYPFVGQFL